MNDCRELQQSSDGTTHSYANAPAEFQSSI